MLLNEMIDIITGMGNYLPEQKVCIVIALAIVLLAWLNFRLGLLSFSFVVSYLFVRSFMSVGDIYSLSVPRIAAGVIIGMVLLFINIYLIARIIAAWED